MSWLRKIFVKHVSRHEGELLLLTFEEELANAVNDYSGSTFSGHPEDQLELIEVRKEWVKRAQAAKLRGWSVSEQSLKDAQEAIAEWESILPIYRGSSEARDRLTKLYISRLEWAEKGLI